MSGTSSRARPGSSARTSPRRLLADGHDVVGVDSFTDYYDPARKRENAERLDVLEADLLDADLDGLLDGVDGVYHLAGQPGVRASFGPDFVHYVDAQRPGERPAVRGRGTPRRPRRLRVVLLDLRRRRELPDAARTRCRGRSRPTG